jgi:2-dehydro-3-deoxyphosphogluconate aldolase/(4S)-4-hydroxy-2-oxoglutarate aldolase
VAGGVKVLEVTLRTPVALQAMEAMAKVPGAIVGAGTLRTAAGAERQERRLPVRRQPGYTEALAAPASSTACRCCPACPPRPR